MAKRASRFLPMAAAAGLAVLAGETLTARKGMADVYETARTSLFTLFAEVIEAPERRPRDLVVNGRPLAFTPYRSARPVDEIAQDWLAVLAVNTRPAAEAGMDAQTAGAAGIANLLVEPKVSRVSQDFAVVVQFFDGNGPAAMANVLAKTDPARRAGGAAATPPMPGVAVVIRRAGRDADADVLMTRFEDVPSALAAFAGPADKAALPVSLRPPAGGEVLSDLGDRGSAHLSRTVVNSARMQPAAWAAMRAALLRRDGFAMEAPPAPGNGLVALRARRGTVEADVLYAPGIDAGEVVEVIEIREPLLAGDTP